MKTVDNSIGVGLIHDGTAPQSDTSGGFGTNTGGPGALKRCLDLAIAIPALVFLLPVLILIAVAIWLDDGAPVVYRQNRRGLRGEMFRCRKFRTMVVDAEERLQHILETDPVRAAEWARDQKLRDDPRLTGIGGFLRKTSLDELPQLLNIIAGDMSIVGPRPIVDNEVRRYGEDIAYYDSVRPGVLGLWQVSGRNDTTYDERVALDVRYAREQSVMMDLKILVLAVPAVLFSKGAY